MPRRNFYRLKTKLQNSTLSKYLVVIKASFAGIRRENQTIVYTTEEQMNRAIREIERNIELQVSTQFFGIAISRLLGFRFTLEIYKLQ